MHAITFRPAETSDIAALAETTRLDLDRLVAARRLVVALRGGRIVGVAATLPSAAGETLAVQMDTAPDRDEVLRWLHWYAETAAGLTGAARRALAAPARPAATAPTVLIGTPSPSMAGLAA
jgi:hypothetical protein